MTNPRGRLIYLVGAPGAGKTTTMRNATRGLKALPADWVSVEHNPGRSLALTMLVDGGNRLRAIELGKRRASFGGTDALPMNISPIAAEWIATRPFRLVLGEGARLGTSVFLSAALAAGYDLTLVHLDADQELLDARCSARGSKQSASWRAGAATRATNLAAWASAGRCPVIHLDARAAEQVLADELATVIVG